MNNINLIKNYDDTLSDLNLLWARRNIDIEIDILDGTRPTEIEEEKKIKEWVLHSPSKRKFAIMFYTFFLAGAGVLTIIGVLFRGPGWNWTYPWIDGIWFDDLLDWIHFE